MATLEMLPLPSTAIHSEDHISVRNRTHDFLKFIREKLEKIGFVAPSTNVVDAKSEDSSSDHKKLVFEKIGLVLPSDAKFDKLEVDEDREKLRHSLKTVVPRKPRTCRFIVGKIIYNPEKGSYYYADGSLYTQKVESRKSKKRYRDDDYAEPSKKQKKSSKKIQYRDDDYAGPSKKKKKKKVLKKFQQDYVQKKKVSNKFQQDYVQPNPPPELPPQFREYIEKLKLDVPPLFVAEKNLTVTDVNPQQSRMSFPERRVNKEFLEKILTEAEKEALKQKIHIEVKFVDDSMHEYDNMHFTRWEMSGKSVYVLTTDWNRLASDNKLVAGMLVRAWCFRKDSRICFCFSVDRESIVDTGSMEEK